MSIILLDIGNVIASVDFLRFCRGVVLDASSDLQAVSRKYCEGDLKLKFDQGIIAPLDYLCMIGRDSLTASMSHGEIRELWQNVFSLLEGAEEGDYERYRSSAFCFSLEPLFVFKGEGTLLSFL